MSGTSSIHSPGFFPPILELYEKFPESFLPVCILTSIFIGLVFSGFFEKKYFWSNFFVSAVATQVLVPLFYTLVFKVFLFPEPDKFLFIVLLGFFYGCLPFAICHLPFAIPIAFVCTVVTWKFGDKLWLKIKNLAVSERK